MSIDSGTRRRLILGFISNWVAKLGYTVIQLVQVPFFLHFWSVPLYGEWMIVTAVPSYLAFSNIGFGSVAGNDMTMSVARGDRESALRVFQSCWWLIVLILCLSGAVGALALIFLPVSEKLRLHAISPYDARWILTALGVALLFGQLEMLLQSAYRCIGRYPYGTFVKSCVSLAAFAAMLVPVGLGAGPRIAALVLALANIAGTILQYILVRRDIPWLHFGWGHASFAEIRRLAPLALAFTGFPLGFGLNIQGTLMAVQYALGPTAVVVFATARTVARVALQMAQMINSTFEPEFSKSFAQRDIALIRSLHRRACQASLLIASCFVCAVVLLGPWVLTHWTGGHVPPSRPLLSILLVVTILYTLWSTSSTVMTATNRHQRLAMVYLVATAVTVTVTYFMAIRFGLYGAAASLLLSELMMNAYVLPASLGLTDDSFSGFFASMFTVPPMLHPRAIFRRLRRSKPVFEELEQD
jgi:O-antigen/teichoic acid export membrane protein